MGTNLERLHAAAPGAREGNQGPDVLVLPLLRLAGEEVVHHGAAHAVHEEDHARAARVDVSLLDQLGHVGEELCVLVGRLPKVVRCAANVLPAGVAKREDGFDEVHEIPAI